MLIDENTTLQQRIEALENENAVLWNQVNEKNETFRIQAREIEFLRSGNIHRSLHPQPRVISSAFQPSPHNTHEIAPTAYLTNYSRHQKEQKYMDE